MLVDDIKVDVLPMTSPVQRIKAKPRTVSSQVGGDDEGRISIAPIFSPPPDTLKLGSFCFDIPHTDAVKPTFRTPPEAMQLGLEKDPAAARAVVPPHPSGSTA